MGKIEEALAKLQAQRSRDASVPAVHNGTEAAGQRPLGRVVDRAESSRAVHHRYRAKEVEINFEVLRAQGLLAPDSQERKLADEYRVVKRPLLKNASGSDSVLRRGNLLMVASALPAEGKTFTCVNLCLSIARERDWDVVLVDGDCNKPHLTRLFGADQEPGLIDLLLDSSLAFDSLVMPTSVPGLSLLPAGKRDEQASELFASSRMGSLCDEISSANPRRIVIFDSPPLLLTTEAPVLASQVGQIVLVVQAGKTPQRAVLAARDKLDPTKAINLLLNQVSGTARLESYGDYGDYYGSAAKGA